MTYWLVLSFSLLFGFALGLMYFGGLWFTVRRARDASRTKRLLLGSFIVRSVLALAGFYLIIYLMGHRWEMVALGLLGFIGGRRVLVHRLHPDASPTSSELHDQGHGN